MGDVYVVTVETKQDIRISSPTSEQQCGRGSRYSPVLLQLTKVAP